jgi:hypothetical protein
MGLSSKQTTGSRGAPAGAFSATCFELPSESCPSVWLGALGEIWNIVDSSCTHVPRSASARARARPREARAHTQTRPWTVNKVPRVCALLSWNLGSESAKLLVQVTHHHGNRSIRSYVFFLIKHRFPIIIKKARTPFGKFVGRHAAGKRLAGESDPAMFLVDLPIWGALFTLAILLPSVVCAPTEVSAEDIDDHSSSRAFIEAGELPAKAVAGSATDERDVPAKTPPQPPEVVVGPTTPRADHHHPKSPPPSPPHSESESAAAAQPPQKPPTSHSSILRRFFTPRKA